MEGGLNGYISCEAARQCRKFYGIPVGCHCEESSNVPWTTHGKRQSQIRDLAQAPGFHGPSP